jgi:[acyl-carrier-protein] S-malonyltransferase
MAAILGLDTGAVETACEAAREVGTVGIANHNCPGQLVITGEAEAVVEAMRLAKEAGAKRALALRVTGAFHSPFMQGAAQELRPLLGSVAFRDASVPVVSNVDAQPRTAGDEIREALAQQIVSPVLWEHSVRAMVGEGLTRFVEVGPGAVLSGMIRRISPEAGTQRAGKAEEIGALVG